MASTIIRTNLGSSLTLDFQWSGDDTPDMTGWTLDLFDVSSKLSPTIEFTDATTGTVRISIPVAPAATPGEQNLGFRPRATPPAGEAFAITLPKFEVVYQ